jgi:voltage-gated potassium channel
MLWIERDGLGDNRNLPIGPMDVLYFAIVTVTTLGYGDIVPISPEARAIVAFGITPLRIVVWLVFLSTAYELVLRRSIERIEMEKLKRSLNNHIIVCGFGVKGRSAVKELIERGTPPNQIIVVDREQKGLEEANRLGVTFLLGNATSEQTLKDAAVEKAAQAIVVPNNDEACVLICLTVKDLAPGIKIRAAAREDENVKLIRRSGADTVVAPSVSSGRLLASSTHSPYSTDLLEELFEHGRGADILDIPVDAAHVGKTVASLPQMAGKLVLGVHTVQGKIIPFRTAEKRALESGDVVIAYVDDGAV